MNDDAELLHHFATEGSEAAFAELVHRYIDLVYAAALRRLGGDTHGAADVAQQVFVSLARQARQLARHTVLPAWLYAATRNVAIDHVRRELRRKAREREAHLMHEADENARGDTASSEWERLRPMLDAAMDELGERDREAVVLRFFAQRPYAAVGAALSISEDAARMRVDRALEKLRIRLATHGITSTGAALGTVLAQQAVAAAPTGMAAAVAGAAMATAAPVAATLGPLAAMLQFMTTSKIVGAAGAAALAVAVGMATYESQGRQTAATSLARVAAEISRLEHRLREAQPRVSAAELARQGAQTALAAAEQAAAPAQPKEPAAAGQEFLARHPEARELWEEMARAELSNQLLAHYRVVPLTPEQREKLESILVQSMRNSRTIGSPAGRITLSRPNTLTGAETEMKAREAIGDEAYARIMTTGRKLSGGLELATQLASAVYRTDPLTDAQTERMLQIFAAAKSGPSTGESATDRRRQEWQTIAADASSVLSAAQIAALEDLRRSDERPRLSWPPANPPGRPAVSPSTGR